MSNHIAKQVHKVSACIERENEANSYIRYLLINRQINYLISQVSSDDIKYITSLNKQVSTIRAFDLKIFSRPILI